MNDVCRQTLERAYLLLDGEQLQEGERVQIESHLEECAPCYERWGINSQMKQLMGRLQGCEPCPSELKRKISDLLSE